jgi:8-oxo-dGTP pyrophosphatase MutT (NUDIX family)
MTQPLDKHYTASVIIVTDTTPHKVLLIHHRKFDKWMQPGGHQEAYEGPIEAAIRETKEETGLDITTYLPAVTPLDNDASIIPVPNYLIQEHIPPHGTEPEHYHLDQFYVVHIPEQAVQHNSSESHGIRWATAAELDTLPTFPNLRNLLKQELAKK